MQIELRDLKDIHPYERNPRDNDKAVDAVARSMQEFGVRVPLVVDEHGTLICGHTRLKAAHKLGLDKLPVHVAHDLTPEQAKAYRLADNATSAIATWNGELLPLELGDLQAVNFDLTALGFDPAELAQYLEPPVKDGLTDANAIPEPPADPITKQGDLWLLGEHRLLCGDSTNADDVRRVMDGKRAVLFATDPPYLVGYDGTNHPHKWDEPDKNKDWSESYGVNWDDADANPDLYDNFVRVAIEEAITQDAAWYCWHASRRQAMVEAVWEKHGAFVHQQIIWNKDRPILTRSHYLWRHEPCFFGWLKGKKPPRLASDYPHSVWDIPTVKIGEETEHPTSKPIEVFQIPMKQHTKAGDVCYEPFAGSGSQIIAAETLGRRCYAIEISPQYVDVCVRRWEEFTGMKAKCIAADADTEEKASDTSEACEVES